jgi:hypothetical protein
MGTNAASMTSWPRKHTLQDLGRFLRAPDDKGQYAVLPPERQWEAEILRTGTTQAPRTCLENIELFLVNHPWLKGEWWWNPRTLRQFLADIDQAR